MSTQIPPQCIGLNHNVDALKAELKELQDELQHASGPQKSEIAKQIKDTAVTIAKAQHDLSACIAFNSRPVFGDPPGTTRPDINPDASPVTKTKRISLNFLQKKFDEFFNRRTDPPLFKIRLHHHDHIPPNIITPDNTPPNSDAEVLFIDALAGYKRISFYDLKQLDYGYYFNDINSTFISVNLDPSQPEPLLLKISFETGGDTEMPSTSFGFPNMDFIDEFSITIKCTLAFDAETGKVDLFGWVKKVTR
jgi:hypothetical protein